MTKNALMVAAVVLTTAACGGEAKDATPPGVPTSAPSASVAPPAASSAAPAASAAPSAAPAASSAAAPAAPAPTTKTKILSFARNPGFGKVDKIGAKDGDYKPDGVKDLVFDIEVDGAATAFILATTDAEGHPNGEFSADTFVGHQTLPPEVSANLNQGKFTGGVVVYEGAKILNMKEGGVALPEGKHKLTLYVSSKDAPKNSAYKAMLDTAEKVVVSSAVVPAAK